jgi:dipeptidyl aminopeptidase/acylaminoacyl peptidase
MYMALKRRGVEAVFVRYPREGHGLREPLHRVDALEPKIVVSSFFFLASAFIL